MDKSSKGLINVGLKKNHLVSLPTSCEPTAIHEATKYSIKIDCNVTTGVCGAKRTNCDTTRDKQ